MSQMYDSEESRTLNYYRYELAAVFGENPYYFSNLLLASGVLSRLDFMMVGHNANRLVDCVITEVQKSSRQYYRFILAISQVPWLRDIVDTLNYRVYRRGASYFPVASEVTCRHQCHNERGRVSGRGASYFPLASEVTKTVDTCRHQCHNERGDLERMLASIHLKDKHIPFIIPPQSLEFDSSGASFVGFGEIRIQIPPYAIPDGSTRQLEIGVCLYGSFKFENNYRPISPILWLCLQGENIRLDKPVKVTLPHILSDLSNQDLAYFGVRFAKAGHDCVTDASGERVYQFQPSVGKSFYYVGGGKGYGTLEIDHFCFMCLEANNDVTYSKAKSMGYCFTSVQGPSRLRVYATYALNTCLIALEKQLDKDDRILTSEHFTLRQDCDHVTVSCDPREGVNMIPSHGKIRETKIDFWGSKKSYEEMKLDHKKKMYPPKVAITAKDLSSVQNIRVMFSNLKEEDDLDMDVTLCQGAGIIELPSTDVSFARQEGDKSDFKVIKAEANYCIPPCWSLEGAHRKGIDGEGITIAVLDSAINRNHAAFAEITLSGKNFIDKKRDDYWCTNREEHGTMVTGIIAKYAPKAEIYVCCVSEEHKFKPKAIIKALEHLKKSYEDDHDIGDKKECHVIVMSFGHYNREEYEDRKKLINDLASKGVICVAAIGNCGLYAGQLAYPALLDEVIAVGGLKGDGYEAATFNPPGEIDMYGPGEAVCYPADTNNSKYRKGRGTSCAAPAIGGIVALLIQHARKSGVKINNVQLIKKIFSHMKTKVPTTTPEMEEKIVTVYNPRKFFCELYETPDKFKALIETIRSSPS